MLGLSNVIIYTIIIYRIIMLYDSTRESLSNTWYIPLPKISFSTTHKIDQILMLVERYEVSRSSSLTAIYL